MKIINCETFLDCMGIILFPIVEKKNQQIDITTAISILSERLSDNNDLLKLQREILQDQLFLDTLASFSHLSADLQIDKTNQYFAQAFSKLQSAYFQERLKDISDVCIMLKKIVLNVSMEFPTKECILYVEEITPYEILHLPNHIKGLIIKNNSMQTHTSILLKERYIPFVNGIELQDYLYKNCLFYDGKLIISPSDKQLKIYEEWCFNKKHAPQKVKLINLSSLNIPQFEFDGIGLFRTEMHALSLGYIPSEQEQYEYYKQLKIGKPVRLRLFDFGEDKQIDNSSERGFRYLKTHTDVLDTQLKSILKCNCEYFEILIPMVTSAEDVLYIKAKINNICNEFGYLKIKVGCMIETPSAVFDLKRILKEVDFINIGTNDLTKYVFATTRENPEYNKEVLQNILDYIIFESQKKNIPYYICGEIKSERN